MTPQYLMLTLLAISSSAVGQLFFKQTALRIRPNDALLVSGPAFLIQLFLEYYFWIALFFYGVATLGWVYVLQHVALSRAYPFMALGYIIIPVLSWFFFNEFLSWRYLSGISLIIVGIVIIGFE
jgi:multidrug transporter EmrE-like cation transporter